MEKGQERVQNSNDQFESKKWRETMNKYKLEREAHKATKKELNIAQDFVATLTNENLALSQLVKDYKDRFIKGGLAVTINDNYISSITVIKPYSDWTYLQDFSEDVNTKRYQLNPYLILDKRAIVENAKQKQKYKRSVIL